MMLAICGAAYACSPISEDAESDTSTKVLPDVETALANVQQVEIDLLSDEVLDKEKGWIAFDTFRAFARNYPDHPLAPSYHMKAAAIARNIPGKALMAIKAYMDVCNKYPKDTLAIEAEFLVGFTFDQTLNDKERSLKAYKAFIEKYPEHPLADQARGLVALRENDLDMTEQVQKWKERGQ